jgi:S1-C subfamily serine protease
VNLLDILIVLAVVAGMVGGYRRGFWLGLAQYAGALAGIVLGARFAPDVVDWFGIIDPAGRQVVALLVIVVASSIGGSIGFWLVGPVRRRLLGVRVLGTLDSLAGAALSAAVTLIVIWLLALTFARGPIPQLAQAIQQSTIIRRVDAAIPASPAFIDRVQQVLSGTILPPVFTGLEPNLPAPVSPSADSTTTDGVRAAAGSTVRIEGLGCGGVATGSGFAVGDDLIVTNAHVVSGTNRTRVSAPNGQTSAAAVVLFDPERDLAILRAPDLDLPALVPGEARPGTRGAVIGYPRGGPLRISPAVVQSRLTARGRDIYSRDIAEREIWIVSAQVRPGNSGGPVVDEAGRFLGTVFASSVSNPGQAYALTAAEIVPSIGEAAAEQDTIDTRRLPCVR